jgi:hypothetical protein
MAFEARLKELTAQTDQAEFEQGGSSESFLSSGYERSGKYWKGDTKDR